MISGTITYIAVVILKKGYVQMFRVPNSSVLKFRFSIKFQDWVCRKTLSQYLFLELPVIDLSQDIKPVSELYGQRL
jgi:hypothetical protein